jgi:hypothetical protein
MKYCRYEAPTREHDMTPVFASWLPGEQVSGHCQSKFVYFAKTSEPDFAAIDFPAFFRVDLSGSMAAPSI